MTRPAASLLLLSLLFVPAAARGEPKKGPGLICAKHPSGRSGKLNLVPFSAPPEIVGVRVGFGGRYKVGQWTPVEVVIQGGSRAMQGRVSLTVPDGDGVPSRVWTPPDRPCKIAPGRETRTQLFARFGRVNCDLTAEFHVDGRLAARAVFTASPRSGPRHILPAIPCSRELIVVVGSDSLGIEEAFQSRRGPDEPAVVVRLDHLDQLPRAWYGYEGVDAVVLSASRPEVYRKLTPDDARIEALDKWIRMGGKLVFCAGARAEEVLDAKSGLARFLPGRFEKTVSLRQTGALETYSGSSVPIPQLDGADTSRLRAARLADVQGKVACREADLPLVVHTPRGFGQVVFVAVEPDTEPLRGWPDRGLLAARLLDITPPPIEQASEGTAMMHFGYDDLAGQLRSALDRFAGVRLVPFWLVAVLIIGYIILIGPGDYFLLRKVIKRMELTWITFPAIVIAVCLGAGLIAYWAKGSQIHANQIDLIDIDATSGLARGTAWANVFSPRMDSYNLSFRPRLPAEKGTRFNLCEAPSGPFRQIKPGSFFGPRAAQDAEVLTSWLGLPGRALGGMNPRTSNPTLWRRQYDFSPNLDSLEGMPIQVASTRAITARWNAKAGTCIEAELVEREDLPTGTITNTLDFSLTECVLAFDRWAYQLGTLGPGESARVGPMARRSELKTLLTGRRIIFDDADDKYHQKSTPYDQGSVDAAYILRMMMFYESAGGRRYTGLLNRYQRFVDLSGLLKAGRAVLVARGPAGGSRSKHHGAELLRDGRPIAGPRDQHVTFYRFVFPVK